MSVGLPKNYSLIMKTLFYISLVALLASLLLALFSLFDIVNLSTNASQFLGAITVTSLYSFVHFYIRRFKRTY